MCLGVPGKVVEVNGPLATVDFWGVRKQIRLEVVDEPVTPGDYILNHVGYAIRRIPPGEVDATLALYEELLRAAEREPHSARSNAFQPGTSLCLGSGGRHQSYGKPASCSKRREVMRADS